MLKFLKCFPRVNKSAFSLYVLHRKYCSSFQPFYSNFFQFSDNIAVIDNLGAYKYRDILYSSSLIAKKIEKLIPNGFKTCERISFLCPSQSTYVAVLLACWISGNIAVPLCSNHPASLLEYHIVDSQSNVVIASDLYSDSIQSIAAKLNVNYFTVDSIIKDSAESSRAFEQSKFFSWDSDYSKRKALIIYTSGSTGPPKGVVLTHGNLYSQISSLVKAWEITSQDSILHTLPLHHMHGIMNALLCLLNVGGTVVMQPKFNASEVWSYLVNENNLNPKVNLYYGVPTMYVKLIEEYRNISENANCIKKSCKKNIRLMTSGSAALPEPVFHQWEDITGHYLLERFGMSEIGMALSNPLKGPRIPGAVGNPLPGVEVKIVEDPVSIDSPVLVEGFDSNIKVFPKSEGKSGELLIRGQTVFKEYWNRKKATVEAFTEDGWFKTGDTATYSDGSFKILGRSSVDIIKSGGYKISALHVESCLLLHTNISDCAVFGVPDEKWGECVVALLVTNDEKEIPDSEFKKFCKKHLPSYSFPSVIKYVHVIPRNVTGKMNKKELMKIFF